MKWCAGRGETSHSDSWSQTARPVTPGSGTESVRSMQLGAFARSVRGSARRCELGNLRCHLEVDGASLTAGDMALAEALRLGPSRVRAPSGFDLGDI